VSDSEVVEFLPIVYCPVCCTPQDSPGFGNQGFSCTNCESTFTVLLVPHKVAAHSITG
jgi:hypothetical protein